MATPLFEHMRKQIFSQSNIPEVVDFHQIPIYLKFSILHQRPLTDTAIIDQNIYLSKKSNGFVGLRD